MIDDKVVDSPLSNDFPNLGNKFLLEGLFYSVNQGNLFIHNKIGVITHPILQGPEPLKERTFPIIYSDIKYLLTNSFHKSKLLKDKFSDFLRKQLHRRCSHDVAEDLMPPKFATKPEFSYAYDFVWEGIDAVFPGDKSGDFELVISERAYIKGLKPGLKYIKITPKDSDKNLSVRNTIKTYKHRFNIYPTYSDSEFVGDGLEDGAVIDVSKLDKTTHKQPFLLLRSCSFDWNEADMNRITVDDNDIAKVGGRYDKQDVLIFIEPGTKKGETTLTITNNQVGIRGIVENTYVRKFTLLVP